ncbi:MAG TPA: PAS domain S-box protein [Phototrophicaceae bacterium]|jgi:PAS domain S-box-containing protein|nr:PAS domain S-box protein [Phototrophicaceae bacterium]
MAPEKNKFLIIAETQADVEYTIALLNDWLNDLAKPDFDCYPVTTPAELDSALKASDWDLILCPFDFALTSLNPRTIIKQAKNWQPDTPLIIISDRATVQDAVDVMRLGASGMVEKFDWQRLIVLIHEELQTRRLRSETRSTERYYWSIVENQTMLVCRYDRDFRLTFANHAYREWIKQSYEALSGMSILDKIPVTDHDDIIAHIRGLTVDHPVAVSVHPTIMPDQTKHWVEWTDRALFDADGQLIEYQASGRDITEQKLAQERLQFLHLLLIATCTAPDLSDVLPTTLQLVCEQLACGYGEIWRIDPGTGVLKNAPDYYLESEHAEILKPFREISERQVFSSGVGIPGDVWETHLPVWIPDVQALSESEFLRKQAATEAGLHGLIAIPVVYAGETLAVMVFMALQTLPYDETMLELLSVALQQITPIIRQQQMHEALRASEKRYRQMFELNGLPKLIVDPDTGELVDANPAAGQFYGYDLETLKTLTIYDVNLSSHEEVKVKLDLARTTRIVAIPCVHRSADGSPCHIVAFTGPIEIEGRQLLHVIITDETEKERAKAALQEAHDSLERHIVERTSELEKSKNRLEAIFDHSGDGILLIDIEHGIQQANFTFQTFYNISLDNVLGKKLSSFFDPTSVASLDAVIRDVTITHQIHHIEARAQRADGTTFDVEISLAPVNRSDQEVTNLVCIVRDISARKEVEAALQKYTEEVQDLYNNAPTGYHSVNNDGVFVQINDTELRWLGYTRGEVIGKLTLMNIIAPSSRDLVREQLADLKVRGWLSEVEVEVKRKNGTTFTVLVSATAVYNASGEFLHSRAILFDITELKQAQRVIAEERNLLRTLIDTSPDYIYLKDTQHRFLLSNLAHALARNEDSPDALIGKTDFDFFPADLAQQFYAREEEIFTTGEPMIAYEEVSRGLHGGFDWAQSSKVPLRNLNGEIIGLAGITHDITRLKASEDALRHSEKQLLESQKMLQLVLDTIPVRVFWKDRNSVLQGCNRLFAQDYGFDAADGIPPWIDHVAGYRPADTTIMESGIPRLDYEKVVNLADGGTLQALASKLPLRNTQGEIIGVLGVYADITARKQAEAALQQKHQDELQMQTYLKALHNITLRLTRVETLDEFYRCAVEQGLEHFGFDRMGLLLYDAENDSAFGTYGTDIEGNLVDEHEHHLNPGSLTGILQRTLDRAERFAFDEDAVLYNLFQPVGRGNNAVATLWNSEALGWLAIDNGIHHQPLTRAQLDILSLYALTVGSLLARKRAEFALRESETRYRLLAENVREVIAKISLDGKITYITPSSYELMGYRPEELVGRSSFIHIHPEDRPLVEESMRGFLIAGETFFTLIGRFRFKQSHYFWFESTNTVVQDIHTGEPLEIIMIIRDITERKQAELALKQSLAQEKELSELKSRFVSMASHEFRTPLAVIMSATETLTFYRERMNQTQVNTRLDQIRQQVMHMKDIIEDVLQLDRIQSGHVEFRPVLGDLDALCQEIVHEFESQAEYRERINYVCERPPVATHFDVRLMRQSITNLISNALKYSPADKDIYIDMTHNSAEITLRITDQGIGIPPEDLKRLFEPFHRATNVGTISGTGLGLSITRQAVELHSGTIIPDSRVGAGTTFTITLPRSGVGTGGTG